MNPIHARATATALALASTIAVYMLLTAAPIATASDAAPIANQFTAQCSNGVAAPNPANNPGLVSDCAALLAAKPTIAGASGSLNWSADIRVSRWDGVFMANYRVSGLSLPEYGLNGAIPAELGSLSNLIWLFLDNNELTGAIPPELGSLANLHYLDLSNNQLTGAIPPELGNLANLENLRLSGNRLTGCIPEPLRRPLGGAETALIGLPFCADTSAADRVGALETQLARLASALVALEAQIADLANRLTALEGATR